MKQKQIYFPINLPCLLIVIIVFIFDYTVYANPGDSLWARSFLIGDMAEGHAVQQTADGGFIVVGFTETAGEGADVWLIKTNAYGDSIWSKTFGGPFWDKGHDVKQTKDGGYIITGYTQHFLFGDWDFLLIKTDSLGNEQWSKSYGGWSDEVAWEVSQTYDGGFILLGYTWTFSAGFYDFWLLKTDSTGDSLWSKSYGGPNEDSGNSICTTSDSGYILVGSSLTSQTGSSDCWIIKTDRNGDSLWSKIYGGNEIDRGISVQQTFDGGYIITGYTESNVSSKQLWLIKTNANGDTMWTGTYGGASFEGGHYVDQTLDAGFIITGYTNSYGAGGRDLWLLKTNSNGDSMWSKTFGSEFWDDGRYVKQTSEGNFIVTGYNTFDRRSLWLIHCDSSFVLNSIDKFYYSVDKFRLFQNYPNPFNNYTSIYYSIKKNVLIQIKIFDITGRLIRTIENKKRSIGNYRIKWDGTNDHGNYVSGGIYFYSLIIDGSLFKTRKMLLIK